MTTHSGDAPTVTLFSDTSRQWRTAIRATVVVSRFRKTLSRSADEQGLGDIEQLQSRFQSAQSGPTSERDDTNGQAGQGENQADPLDPNWDPQALEKTLEDKNPEVEVLKHVRDELVKQLDAYGLVLVLLAGITFVAILQPPGSFDNGKLQDSPLVSLFMLLATLSFFIACTGLGAVMVGCAELFRPIFYPKLVNYAAVSESKRLQQDSQPTQNRLSAETSAIAALKNWLLGFWEISPSHMAFNDIDVLAKLCVENVYRIMRIRFYLGVALVLCIAAYICGALAVMVTNDRQRYLLIGAMAAGVVIVLFEIGITLLAAMKPVAKHNHETVGALPE